MATPPDQDTTDPLAALRAPAASAVRAIAGAVIRTLLKIVGTALVARGLVDQGTADGLLASLAEQLAGAVMVGVASAWSVIRAAFVHSRWAAAWRVLRGLAPSPMAIPPSPSGEAP